MSTSIKEPWFHPLLLSIITTILLLAIILHILYCYFRKKTQLVKSLISLSLLSMCSWLIFSLIYLSISIMEFSKSFTSTHCIMYYLKDLLMMIGKIFMYSFFIVRIYFIFDGSLFYYRKLWCKLFLGCVFLAALIPSLMILSSVILPIHSIIQNPKQYEYIDDAYDCSDIFAEHGTSFTKIMMVAGIALFTLLDITISIIILRLYLTRLLSLSIAYVQLKQQSNMNHNSTNNIMNNNTIFLQTAMKIFNLATLAITTSFLGIIFQSSGYGSHWLCIDISINSIAMYLSFSCAENIYNKVSVICCTNYCFNGWRRLCICCCCVKNELSQHVQLSIIPKSKEHQDNIPSVSDTSMSQIPALTQQTY